MTGVGPRTGLRIIKHKHKAVKAQADKHETGTKAKLRPFRDHSSKMQHKEEMNVVWRGHLTFLALLRSGSATKEDKLAARSFGDVRRGRRRTEGRKTDWRYWSLRRA